MVRVRLLDDGFRLTHRQLGSGAGLELQQRELVRRLRSLECALRHREKLVVGEQRKVLVRNLGDEQDLHRLACLRRGKVLLQRLVVQALQPAEEVDLPGRGYAHGIVVRHERLARGRKTRGSARRRRIGESTDLRKHVGALYPVLRLRLRHVQCRDAQVQIVRQRDLDQSLQPWVGQEVAPTDIDGRQRRVARSAGRPLVGIAGRIGRGHRCGGPLVHRLERATGQQS